LDSAVICRVLVLDQVSDNLIDVMKGIQPRTDFDHPLRSVGDQITHRCLLIVGDLVLVCEIPTHTRLTALFRDYPGEPVPER